MGVSSIIFYFFIAQTGLIKYSNENEIINLYSDGSK